MASTSLTVNHEALLWFEPQPIALGSVSVIRATFVENLRVIIGRLSIMIGAKIFKPFAIKWISLIARVEKVVWICRTKATSFRVKHCFLGGVCFDGSFGFKPRSSISGGA
jgi:hypothetical protein